MKNKLLFLSLIATGIVQKVEPAGSRLAMLAERFSLAGCLATSFYAGYKNYENMEKDFLNDFDAAKAEERQAESILRSQLRCLKVVENCSGSLPFLYKDAKANITTELASRHAIKDLCKKLSGKDVVLSVQKTQTVSNEAIIFLAVKSGKGKDAIFYLGHKAYPFLLGQISRDVILTDHSGTKFFKFTNTLDQLKALMIHECGHLVCDDNSNARILKSLEMPSLALGVASSLHAMRSTLLKIKNPIFMVVGSLTAGLVGGATGLFSWRIAQAKYSRFCEKRADEFVFNHNHASLIKPFKAFHEQIKTIRTFFPKKTFVETLFSAHPSDEKRIAACDKALEKLEQEEFNKVD